MQFIVALIPRQFQCLQKGQTQFHKSGKKGNGIFLELITTTFIGKNQNQSLR